MPTALSYPGVYIEEVSNSNHAISGISTSTTAFIGRALQGLVNEAVTVNNYGEFERLYGGLWNDSTLGFAVRDFYNNGGNQAVIVRLFHTDPTVSTSTAYQDFFHQTTKVFTLEAISAGTWGNQLQITIDHNVPSDGAYGLNANQLFNLTVKDLARDITERFTNLSVINSTRRIDTVLKMQSQLVAVAENSLVTNAGTPDVVNNSLFIAGNDGLALTSNDFDGMYVLDKIAVVNLLCIPPYLGNGDIDSIVLEQAASYCEQRNTFLIIDPPASWNSVATAQAGIENFSVNSENAAIFFPRIIAPNPLKDNQLETFVPCGVIAGVICRLDAARGLWKSPAGTDATLKGIARFAVSLSETDVGELNQLSINCLRTIPGAGPAIWGARTLQGADQITSIWKYISVRRMALYLQQSIYQSLQWVISKPNDEFLWSDIRLNINGFMNTLFRQGAFQGTTAQEAYFVKCDAETTTATDVLNGVVNILVGFAPLSPAEFVVLEMQQIATK